MVNIVEKGNTIQEIVKRGLCIGCGTCAVLCPNNALTITECHQTGTYLPQLDYSKCNRCGICLKICPGSEVDFNKLNLTFFNQKPRNQFVGNYIKCYSGYATDQNVRCKSASGGLITALSTFALEDHIVDGILTTRATAQKPLRPNSFIARTEEEVNSAVGSKYCPVPVNSSINKILENQGRYIIIGLPCHIQGLRKAQIINNKLKNRISLVFGIVCNHTPTFHATDFLLKKLRISKEKVTKLDYRSKDWPGGINITVGDCWKHFIPFSSSYYWGYVFQKFFWSKRCMICDDKLCQLADIIFMDPWLPRFSSDRMGSSLVAVRSKKGEEFIAKALEKGVVKLQTISIDEVLRSQKMATTIRSAAARSYVLKYPSKNSLMFQKTKPAPSILDLLEAFHLVSINNIYRKDSKLSQLMIDLHAKLWDFARFAKRVLTKI